MDGIKSDSMMLINPKTANAEVLRWAYRILLDREPENEMVLTREFRNIEELRKTFLNSGEYRSRPTNLQNIAGDYYYGYNIHDFALCLKYCEKNLVAAPGYITNFLGIKTSINVLPGNVAFIRNSGKTFPGPPFPNDGFHGGAIEYISVLLSLEAAKNDFTMFELGAGWAPWMCTAGVVGRKLGLKKINLIGVEGQSNKIDLIKSHLMGNGLAHSFDGLSACTDGINIKLYNGLVSKTSDKMDFPEVPLSNYGASVVVKHRDALNAPKRMVDGYSLKAITQDYSLIDLIHMDLQGYETEIVSTFGALLKEKVKYLFIGTHSRRIEVDLIDLLYPLGFKLIREEICITRWPERPRPDIYMGCLQRDGAQIWQNTNLKS